MFRLSATTQLDPRLQDFQNFGPYSGRRDEADRVNEFFHQNERLRNFLPPRIIGSHLGLGGTDPDSALMDAQERLYKTLTKPENAADILGTIIGGRVPASLGHRADNRNPLAFAHDLLGNWQIEDEIQERLPRHLGGATLKHLSPADADRQLGWGKGRGITSDPDFAGGGREYQLKNDFSRAPAFHVKPNEVPRPDAWGRSGLLLGKFNGLGYQDREGNVGIPNRSHVTFGEIPWGDIAHRDPVEVPAWGGKMGHRLDFESLGQPFSSQDVFGRDVKDVIQRVGWPEFLRPRSLLSDMSRAAR